MPSETAITRAFIAHILQNDSVVQAIIGGKFYAGSATAKAGNFYIVYSFAGGQLTKNLGMRRRLVRLLYDVKVYQRGSGDAAFTTLVNRVDGIFSNIVNQEYRGWNFSSLLETPIDLPENDKDKDEQWSALGGTYRFSTYKL